MMFYFFMNIIDDLVKSLKMLFSVIPVQTGIQSRSERDSNSTILSGLPLPAFARTGFAGETTF